jgi:3-deoxy-D-manno-octulosonic-acid transferase
MYLAYSLLLFIVYLVATPYFVYQAVRYRKYIGTLDQRFGFLPLALNVDGEESIWIHAVSVGVTMTARALVADLKQRYPGLRLFLSTTTMAGQQVARQLPQLDGTFYFPFDWMFIVRRTLNVVKPRLFIMTETEIWPNLLRACRARGVKTVLVNGRISPRSYPRYQLVRPLFKRVLANVDGFCVQNEESARRLVALGADPSRVTITGSLKFDSVAAPTVTATRVKPRDPVLRYFRVSQSRLVVVAGSTMRGEETAVLRAFKRVKASAPTALLVLAPRHPERFDEAEHASDAAGFSTMRRSALPIDADPRADVVVLDTVGELPQVYQIATAVFVGGSLTDHGGHNILEPAVFGKPILFGPFMQNFKEIAAMFLANEAALQVEDDQLDDALTSLVFDPVRRARLGAAARALVEANRGAKDKTLAAIAGIMPPAGRHAQVRPFRLV